MRRSNHALEALALVLALGAGASVAGAVGEPTPTVKKDQAEHDFDARLDALTVQIQDLRRTVDRRGDADDPQVRQAFAELDGKRKEAEQRLDSLEKARVEGWEGHRVAVQRALDQLDAALENARALVLGH